MVALLAPGNLMAILSKEQFKQIKPSGSYDAYLKYVAKHRNITVAELKTTAKVGLPPKQMEQAVAAAYASGGVPAGGESRGAPAAGGGGRLSQSPEKIRERGYIKWDGEKYEKGEGLRLYMALAAKGVSFSQWAKRWPTLAKFVGKPQAPAALTKQIRTYLAGRGSPLAQYAEYLTAYSIKQGVDPRLVVAIAGAETTFATNPAAGRDITTGHNAWGMGPHIQYGSWEKGIKATVDNLSKNYLGIGLHSAPAISRKWVGYASPSWLQTVPAVTRELGGDPNDFRWRP